MKATIASSSLIVLLATGVGACQRGTVTGAAAPDAVDALGVDTAPLADGQDGPKTSYSVALADLAVRSDLLFVIDNSASMCQEQTALAAAFDGFLARLQSFVSLDYRIAVVTTDVLTQDTAGLFRHQKKTEFPLTCQESMVLYCDQLQKGDDACATEAARRSSSCPSCWTCKSPSDPMQITNCNDTVNSQCKLRCSNDAQCDTELVSKTQGEACTQDPASCRYKCLMPSGDPASSGCILRPDTGACPGDADTLTRIQTDGVPFLTNATAPDLFKCIALVGAEQHNNANLESGLNAALLALDAQNEVGLEAAQKAALVHQAETFVRADAHLGIVVISDEEDCSLGSGKTVSAGENGRCLCIPDTRTSSAEYPNGGLLRPVDEVVTRLKALKSGTEGVFFAAIIGDSLATDPTSAQSAREAFRKSKCGLCDDPTAIHSSLLGTYICESPAGKADYGARYVATAEAFGPSGVTTNICDPSGMASALSTIADRMATTLQSVCLPRSPTESEALEVRVEKEDGSVLVAQEGTGDLPYDLRILPSCATALRVAVAFREALPRTATVLFNYVPKTASR